MRNKILLLNITIKTDFTNVMDLVSVSDTEPDYCVFDSAENGNSENLDQD